MAASEPAANQMDTSATVEASARMKITMAASQKTASQFIVIPPFPGFTGMIGLY